ncbi:MAG: DUF4129 domain-containing protein [Chloroflexota bacterium]
MAMWTRDRKQALFFFSCAAALVLILAAGISSVTSGAPMPFRREATGTVEGLVFINQPFVGGVKGAIFLFGLLYLIAFVSIFLTREGRIRLAAFVALLAAMLLCIYMSKPAFRNQAQPTLPVPKEGLGFATPVVAAQAEQPGEIYQPNAPGWLVAGVGVILAGLVAGAAVFLVWILSQRKPPRGITESLSQEAQAAVDALEAGGDFKDIVVRCYARMSQVLREERGLRREIDMTPREFEKLLTQLGFPAGPVCSLTRLFEEVRYGDIRPDQRATQQAISYLSAIVDYCKALGEAQRQTQGLPGQV